MCVYMCGSTRNLWNTLPTKLGMYFELFSFLAIYFTSEVLNQICYHMSIFEYRYNYIDT